MPEPQLPEDEAVPYVLGELSAVERREFEARLSHSAELRALVRDLEEGALALSMASPQRRCPREVWTRIEEAVAREERWKVVIRAFWAGWWRNAWAAAAACLVGWLLCAIWMNRPGLARDSSTSIASGVNVERAATVPDSPRDTGGNATKSPIGGNEAFHEALELLQARVQEIGALQWQLAELTNRMSRLSQAVSEQQSLLAEPSRLKFFQLTPGSADSSDATVAPVSTNLQRALVAAMARELYWVPSGSLNSVAEAATAQERLGNSSNSAPTNQAGIDFVDLRTGTNGMANPIGKSPAELESAARSEPPSLASASANAIPGFISGTNMVLAFDASVVPTGSSLTFWTATSWGQYESLGAAVLGDNPLVVTVPFATRTWVGGNTWAGGNITVIAGTADGTTNVFHFATPGPVSP
jgi:hypothetical protein